MANDLTANPLFMDTAAIVSATTKYRIRKIRLIPAAAAATASFEDGAGRVFARLAAAANGAADEIDFNANPYAVTGLELAAIAGAGAVALIYCE